MCGIAGIITSRNNVFNISEKIKTMSAAIAHRGPDGEGFILASPQQVIPYFGNVSKSFSRKDLPYAPSSDLENLQDAFLAFAHRRLSIIDVTETGHQPMCNADKKHWITFNGEIYNYIELKEELAKLGHHFVSGSDTEVILASYKEWGTNCVKRFNGMWAFCLYDIEKEICFASRDRLGVKPFYCVHNDSFFAFASEQKAFVKAGLIKAEINGASLHNYLVNGLLETAPTNFFENVIELFPGQNLIYSIKNSSVEVEQYYVITETRDNEELSDAELISKIEETLYNAVKVRLRSDVEVGACLSGGIDSSVLCGLMSDILQSPIYCFTSVFKNQPFNEESFADIVSAAIHANHKKIEPTKEGFINEISNLVYSQDVPIWDSSTYAQFKVMELAKQNNIKVVIDGQGADELFGGYHHHFVAKWNNLSQEEGGHKMVKDIKASRVTFESPFVFYAKEKIKQKTNLKKSSGLNLLNKDFVASGHINNTAVYYNSVNQQLFDDIYRSRLKTFLKCEDRCGMWHSVESRTPFSDDVNLIDLVFSFNGNRKIQKGISKYLLREASKNILPQKIYNRYDKKGFETPMHQWTRELSPMMINEIKESKFGFVNKNYLDKLNTDNIKEAKMLFKLFILSRWYKVFT